MVRSTCAEFSFIAPSFRLGSPGFGYSVRRHALRVLVAFDHRDEIIVIWLSCAATATVTPRHGVCRRVLDRGPRHAITIDKLI
jgi:hypothetical protein